MGREVRTPSAITRHRDCVGTNRRELQETYADLSQLNAWILNALIQWSLTTGYGPPLLIEPQDLLLRPSLRPSHRLGWISNQVCRDHGLLSQSIARDIA